MPQRLSLVWDVLALAGLVLLTAGVACVYAPLGLIVPGGVFLFLGIWGARRCS
jgi:hypothetical protein